MENNKSSRVSALYLAALRTHRENISRGVIAPRETDAPRDSRSARTQSQPATGRTLVKTKSEARVPACQHSSGPHRSVHNPFPPWKRTLDIACILFALPAVLPLITLIALAIRMCSRGPVIFRQERIGLFGEPFVCLKFRTMKVEAETNSHEAHLQTLIHSGVPMRKLDSSGDYRVIPMGSFLRATGLDELPQLLNVLKGEMSLVGPRPCIRYEYEKFRPQDRARFDAVPGLTGLWQVSGKNSTTFQRMIELDIEYARNLSLAGDLKILCRTLPFLATQASEFLRCRALPLKDWKARLMAERGNQRTTQS